MSLSTTQHEGDGQPVAFCSQVNLSSEPTAGSPECFTFLTTSRASGALMGSDHCAIHEVLGPVELTFQVSLSQECIEDGLPDAFGAPPPETTVNRGPLAEAFRNVPPGSSSPKDPNNSADDRPMVKVGPSKTDFWRE